MIERVKEDRRVKDVEIKVDSRKASRRKYDQIEENSYYVIISVVSVIIIFFGVMSYLQS